MQFSFSASRINDSLVRLHIISPGTGATGFAALSQEADALRSELNIDGQTLVAKDITYSGSLPEVKEIAGLGRVRYFKPGDTVFVLVKSAGVRIKGRFNWLGFRADAFPTGAQEFNIPVESATVQQAMAAASGEDPSGAAKRSMASTIFWSFMAGLGAVFTPCVFPLITVTVSYFLKRNLVNKTAAPKSPVSKFAGISQALIYSLSIILIYTIPTLVITTFFGDTALYSISTSALANLLFFLIFILFAFSFFGAYELTLPSAWATKTDEVAGKGGYTGIFFMALTLVIVSFSCTGPIVGSLLSQTSTAGIALAPVLGILAFSMGLALPFTLFALFPKLMEGLPRSGGWLNSVKVIFGFLELALAMKFLSNVDLIYHWGLLNRDVFLSIWIVIALLMGFYLLGKLRFSHDEPLNFISVPRLMLALGCFSFAVYLVPGLWGAPIRSLSGLLPPATTQEFDLHTPSPDNPSALPSAGMGAPAPVKYTDILKMPLGLTGYFDLEEAKQASAFLKKPILIDFTGHSCANCRKMEEEVWAHPSVKTMLQQDFVLLSLYVDERTPLPETEIYTNATGEVIETLGEKNLDFERTRFGFGAQPLYMFIDENENLLSQNRYGYDSDVNKFLTHLQSVKAAYKSAGK